MPIIKLKKLIFDLPPFRKLQSISIDFADRITVVAGHNGIGKSTILGLVANGSGLTFMNLGDAPDDERNSKVEVPG